MNTLRYLQVDPWKMAVLSLSHYARRLAQTEQRQRPDHLHLVPAYQDPVYKNSGKRR